MIFCSTFRIPLLIRYFIAFRNSTSEIFPSPYHFAVFLTHSGTEAKPKEKKLSYEPSAYIQSKIKIGTEKYLIKFNLCAGDKTLDKVMVLIKSQIEAIQVGSNKDVPANACRSYETQIFAKNPDNIFIEILEEVIAK
ncbi:MAG TPA: hypothetical protein OQH54_03930 [Nitrosopumilus sp.]|nr:hypothetical protein [Thermoproteota archaeon]HJJ22848.1 hypothetical protein [Nitrosopumilus sp.]